MLRDAVLVGWALALGLETRGLLFFGHYKIVKKTSTNFCCDAFGGI